MRFKYLASFFFSILLLTIATRPVSAALVTVDPQGRLVWNVLASEDEQTASLPIPKREELQVKNVVASPAPPTDAEIALVRQDGKVELNIKSGQGNSKTDVTDYKNDLIEIEERGEAKKIKISNLGDKFSIEQNGISAVTIFPIMVNSKTSELTVSTDSGTRLLAMLPFDAASSVLRTNIINSLRKIELTEGTKGVLQYDVEGEKKLNILNVYSIPVKVKTSISALNGEVIKVDEPVWLKVFGFLFS